MEANRYQLLAYRTANHNLSAFDQLRNAVYGLNGEAGEVIDILKKHEFQGHTLNKEKLIDELGDIAWYLALGCTALGVTLTDIFNHNVEKLSERYPEGFDPDKSIHRKE